MMNKVVASCDEAVADIFDGATIAFGGFVGTGYAVNLIEALHRKGTRNITAISTMAAGGLLPLHEAKQVVKMITSFPVFYMPAHMPQVYNPFEEQLLSGEAEVEICPQGTLVMRMWMGGGGYAGFYTPVGVGTKVAEGKEVREFDGKQYILERALRVDFALIKAWKADRWGNLIYRKGAINFNPAFATAADVTIVEAEELVELGELDPTFIHTPGIYVDRLVVAEPKWPEVKLVWPDQVAETEIDNLPHVGRKHIDREI